VLAAAALAGCAAQEQKPPPAPPAPAAVPPASPPPVLAPPPVSAEPTPSTSSRDACGAADLQYLVGKPHTDIPIPVDPARRRVLCSTCVATQGADPNRQTIIYSSASGLVTSVYCG